MVEGLLAVQAENHPQASWAVATRTPGITEAEFGRLDHFEHDGRTYWFGQPPPDDGPPSPRAHLLQILDEYYRGYQDSLHAAADRYGRFLDRDATLVTTPSAQPA